MVVEGALGDAGRSDDVVDRHRIDRPFRKQPPAGGEQGIAGAQDAGLGDWRGSDRHPAGMPQAAAAFQSLVTAGRVAAIALLRFVTRRHAAAAQRRAACATHRRAPRRSRVGAMIAGGRS